MELPDDIEHQVLEYLRLEYGEDPKSKDSLQLLDLKYEGVHEVDGVPAHCWSFPSKSDDVWATVSAHGDTYTIGMTSIPVSRRDQEFSFLKVRIAGATTKKIKIPYIKREKHNLATLGKIVEVELDDGRKLAIHSELYFTPQPMQGIISVTCGQQEFGARFCAGANIYFRLDSDTTIFAEIGDLLA